GVSIGPFCTVGSGARLGDSCQLHAGSHVFGNTELGDGCILLTGAIAGCDLPGCTVIGSNNRIGYHAVVGVKCQDMKYKVSTPTCLEMEGDECFLYMGNNNDVREFASIHRSSKATDRTVIGDTNLIMGCCHIAHDCRVGSSNIFANNSLLAGHVVVEVSQDVPRYMMVAGDRAELRGLNLEGLRRHGFSNTEIKSLRGAYQKIFMPIGLDSSRFEDRMLSVEQTEELYNLPVVKSMIQSIRDSFQHNRRGICNFRNRISLED
ncbi:putative acyl-[acyl-carrier-protein]--UDP-N-acetylglucosamine O-acyltransferase, partial [Nymphaea thermarum]